MDAKNIAEAIGILGLLGLPELIVVLTVGGLVFGFATFELFAFLNNFALPLLAVGIGIFTILITYRYAEENQAPKILLMGIGIAMGMFAFVYLFFTHAFSYGGNSYSLLQLSLSPTDVLTTGFNYALLILQVLFYFGGAGLFFLEVYQLRK